MGRTAYLIICRLHHGIRHGVHHGVLHAGGYYTKECHGIGHNVMVFPMVCGTVMECSCGLSY